MSKADTQSYMVVRVNDRTGERIDLLDTPVSHKKALTIKSKAMSPLPRHLRTVLEPRGPRERIVIHLEPELERMFQLYQQNHDLALAVLGDELYSRQVRMPKHSGTVSMLDEPKVAIRHVFDWAIPTSKSAHAQRADFFRDLARKMDDEWNATVDMAIEAYGKQGSLISGVYRDHFPNDVKDRLRFLSHGKSLATDAARLHDYLSKTRSPLFQ